jgi:hypothetical protein
MSLLSLVVAFGVMTLPQPVVAAGLNGESESSNTVTGTFDGLDLKQKRIWISDMVFLLDSAVSVKGTSVKLGLITDLKQGETVKAYLRENEADEYVPYVTKIERQ